MQSLKLQQVNKKLAINTFKNASVSILLAIIMIIFNLLRTGLTSSVFGVDSLGLLTIVLGLLPYISSSHNAILNVSTAKLYSSIHHSNYHQANRDIANLKPQFYLFGCFYLFLIVIISFSFPFIASNNGMIIIQNHDNTKETIEWYKSTLFILSNGIELIATYFIIPVSIILLFINHKSYIFNGYNILITILMNGIIIGLYVLKINKVINLSFIEMNIITISLLGSKMFFILLFLIPYKVKLFSWYKKEKSTNKKLTKSSVQSMLSAYLNQFSSDLISILLLIYASLSTSTEHTVFSLRHGGSHGSEISNFIPSAIYSTFLMLIISANEIVHSIVDAAIPSVAEHASYNNKKINKHFFHRYQVLSVFIACFTTTTYILTASALQSLFLEQENSFHDIKILNMLIGLLWIPILIDVFISMYKHILTIFSEFGKILYINLIKSLTTLIPLVIINSIVFAIVDESQWIYAVMGSILSASIISNLITYFIARLSCFEFIIKDHCINVFWSTFRCFIYIIITQIIMLPIINVFSENIFHLKEQNNIYILIGIPLAIVILNFLVNIVNIYIFRKNDFMFYLSEIKNKKWNKFI